jgi:hypothetical protein
MTDDKITTKDSTTPPPANISEFNTITGLVFSQLYGQFPVSVDLDQGAIASAMGAVSPSTQVLQSGRQFTEVFAHSLNWLSNEGYVRSAGPLAYEKVTLTTKGLAVLNAVPQGLSVTVGTTLATNASVGNWSGVGDLIGGVIGGFAKSVSGSSEMRGKRRPASRVLQHGRRNEKPQPASASPGQG